ncbi:hypothetical protein V6259_17990 [Marinomonas sp. TI.3.20]|uniref:hypothetical protein n=1 Tax=Marinomonas sp. TI.3.20 TaxID=3121296 RepID=UPI00311E07CC
MLYTKTFKEHAVGGYHDSSAYERSATIDSINEYPKWKEAFNLTVQTKIHGDRHIIYKMHKEDCADGTYIKKDQNDEHLYIDGKLQYLSFEEKCVMLGANRFSYWFAAFDSITGLCVARTQDEWGCLLVLVADEYRNLGIGSSLVQMTLRRNPEAYSGGFTPQGFHNRHRAFSNIVREDFAAGGYRKAYLEGSLSISTIRLIRDSLKPAKSKIRSIPQHLFEPNDPSKIMYYSDGGATYSYHTDSLMVGDIREESWGSRKILEKCLGFVFIMEAMNTPPRLLRYTGMTPKHTLDILFLAMGQLAGKSVYIDTEDAKNLELERDPRFISTSNKADSNGRLSFTVAVDTSLVMHKFNSAHNHLIKRFDEYNEKESLIFESLDAMSESA